MCGEEVRHVMCGMNYTEIKRGIRMEQIIEERIKKQLDARPSNCKHCKLEIANGNAEYICERTERHTLFGVKAEKCYGDCDLYEKSFPEMFKDTIFCALKSEIGKIKPELPKSETTDNSEIWESGYMKCKNDVLKIIDSLME